jgi:hypothetical protein
MTEYWFRYESKRFAPPVDEFGNSIGLGRIEVRILRFPVVKVTRKGAWLDVGLDKNRFVLKDGNKRFACQTRQEALQSFVARKLRQISILRVQLSGAEDALRIVRLEHLSPVEIHGDYVQFGEDQLHA